MKKENIQEFRRNLRHVEREVDRQLKAETNCCGVTLAQCHVLIELGECETLTLAALARRLCLDASTLSRTVDLLVKAKLVNRVTNPTNRRSVALSLTAKGRTKVNRLNQDCNAYYGRMLHGLPEQKKVLLLDGIKLVAGFFRQRQNDSCCSQQATGLASKGEDHGRS